MNNRQYCLLLNLKDDEKLIKDYEEYHRAGAVWPEVVESIKESGIESMRIYRLETSLVMIVEVNDQFSFEAKASKDKNNQKVQEWERLMDRFQNVGSNDLQGSKWRLASRIFDLAEQ